MADSLDDAAERFRALTTYQLTIRATAADGERQVIRYFYRKPGWVRMDFIQPHSGMVVIFDPVVRKVRLWPFGLNRAPALRLGAGNPLLRSRSGQRIDRSDIGALLTNLQELRACGSMMQLGESALAARAAIGLDIVGSGTAVVAGVHRYRVWLATASMFPLRVESFDVDGAMVETVEMADVEIDVPFDERLFAP
ncbi:DUF1571 domain-containing protein [Janthinobacterium sp. 17J80-10]|uniref:DUF1571 domain-containing protein n=1 Tax=Janthinobacterium sp. 17J80-10 TaxID=2497863 RepID=UPI0019D6BED4|nr:DUF1571 domain-containing protein [Janthinobacterium sp. 17J80-10]